MVTHVAGQVNLRHKRRKEIVTGLEDWEIILFEMASKLRFHRGSQFNESSVIPHMSYAPC